MNNHFVIQISCKYGHANVTADTEIEVIAKTQPIIDRFTKSDSPPIAISKPYACQQLAHGPWDETPPVEFLETISQLRHSLTKENNGRTQSFH